MAIKVKVISPALAKANGLEPGHVLDLAERGGVVLDRYWRARCNDAAFDNCVEVVKIEQKPLKKSTKNVDS